MSVYGLLLALAIYCLVWDYYCFHVSDTGMWWSVYYAASLRSVGWFQKKL